MLAMATANPVSLAPTAELGARATAYRAPRPGRRLHRIRRRPLLPIRPAHAPVGGGPCLGAAVVRLPLECAGRRGRRALPRPIHDRRRPSARIFRRELGARRRVARTARVAGPSVRMGRIARALGAAPGPRRRAQGRPAALSLRRRPRRRSEARRRRLRAARRPVGERRQGAALVADRMAEGGPHPRALVQRGGKATLPRRSDLRSEGADALSRHADRRALARQAAGRRQLGRRARAGELLLSSSSMRCACWRPGRPIRCFRPRPEARKAPRPRYCGSMFRPFTNSIHTGPSSARYLSK